MLIQSYDKKKGKLVKAGTLDFTSGVYRRLVKPRHLMFTLNSYAISEDVIKALAELDCQTVRLESKTKVFESSFSDWLQSKVVRDYGHGRQYFLSIDRMKKIEKIPNKNT